MTHTTTTHCAVVYDGPAATTRDTLTPTELTTLDNALHHITATTPHPNGTTRRTHVTDDIAITYTTLCGLRIVVVTHITTR